MKIFDKVIKLVKENWKAMLFTLLYIYGLCIAISLSFGINTKIIGTDYSMYSVTFLAIALIALLAIISKFVLVTILKEDAEKISKKSSLMFIPIGIAMIVVSVLELIEILGNPFESAVNVLIKVLFLIPAYFGLLIVFGLFFIIINFVAFLLLRFTVKHQKAIISIFLIFSILWAATISNIRIPIDISIGKVNNSQELFRDIISMEDSTYNTVNTYFIYNDRIYAYIYGKKDYNNYKDQFFSVDLKGKNKKVITNSDKMHLAQFIDIYNNDAYYYTTSTNSINKVNLESGAIIEFYKFPDNYGGWWYVQYKQVVEKFYELLPQCKASWNNKYEIINENYMQSIEPETITLKNIQKQDFIQYNNIIYSRIQGDILYIIYAEKINKETYENAKNLKNIYVERIILE